ncbi:glycoside hydrolase family 76 protein [Xylariaceae sp. FL0662B]|nr:glycoside hydrolase family 76 protein [Xylariaceae sp. FL0662B]
MKSLSSIATIIAFASVGATLSLDVSAEASIKKTASEIAKGLYVYHDPEATTGQFTQPQPWFWWMSGSAWNGLLDYMVYTGDTTYKSDLLYALAKNLGPKNDFAPTEQASWEANDDQVYWVYNALTAMEYNFEALPCDKSGTGAAGDCANSWLAISTNAFEEFVGRWNADSGTCGGGLKWQYNPAANGYYYKNSVTNGGFFQTAARLARYTGNQTFADWANKIYDWSTSIGLVSSEYQVFDGAGDDKNQNCSVVSQDQWSYNMATYIHGAAHMYAFTKGDSTWESRVKGLVNTAKSTFFSPTANITDIMYEKKCELDGKCNVDQTSFKASLSRWLGKTAVLVPSVSETVMSLLESSAQGAALSCSGYSNSTCGMKWYTGGFDGQSNFGVELSALETVQSLLVKGAPELAVAAS